MKENGKMEKNQVQEKSHKKMEINIKDNFKMINIMDQEDLFLQTSLTFMKVISLMDLNRDLEYRGLIYNKMHPTLL